MSIGILTYHWVANYGANLQTISTYKFLESKGYNPIIINWIPSDTYEYYSANTSLKQLDMHMTFIKSFCNITDRFSNIEEFEIIISKYNIQGIIIGSDSLFNIIPITKKKDNSVTSDHIFPNPFWGEGFIELPHVGLSISSQNSPFEKFKKNKNEIEKYINSFSALTVRDDWTQAMVNYFTNGKIIPSITPDPVFAFNTNVQKLPSKEEILLKYHLPDNYVLFTFNPSRKFNQEWLNEVKNMFHKVGKSCVSLPKTTGSQKIILDYDIKLPINPIDWYSLIKYSSGYIGVLMHPIIICLHNSVPFYSFDHYGDGPRMFTKKTSSKIYHILKKANLLNNHVLLKNTIRYPKPMRIFKAIENFPFEQCRQFSINQEEKALQNMNYLVSKLKL